MQPPHSAFVRYKNANKYNVLVNIQQSNGRKLMPTLGVMSHSRYIKQLYKNNILALSRRKQVLPYFTY